MLEAPQSPAQPLRPPLLYVTVLLIATCGLVYELLAGALASYVLGDSVTRYSTLIGLYLFAMGVGSYLSRFIERGVARRFVEVELGVAVVGGGSAPLLFLAFGSGRLFQGLLYGLVFLTGTLVGLEIPLLLRILKSQLRFKDLVSQVLTFDYLGALLASLVFPLVLVPKLGLVRTSLLVGLVNAAVGLWSTFLLAPLIGATRGLRLKAALACALLVSGLALGERLTDLAEARLYADEVVYAKSSPYQRIVVTRGPKGFSLFLNGALQFHSADEYRYHEALVHPAMIRAPRRQRVLILGGGDGLAAREVLRYPEVEAVTLVDLDPEVTRLATSFPALAELNGRALEDMRVKVVNEDAMRFLAEDAGRYDVIFADFPDPHSFSVGKLYTTRFYGLLKARLAEDGVAVIQSTSPLYARRSFWCVVETLKAAGLWTLPYHAHVPSFGEWGFVLAAHAPLARRSELPRGLRFLTEQVLPTLEQFPPDMDALPAEPNRLHNQVLVRTYEEEWGAWN